MLKKSAWFVISICMSASLSAGTFHKQYNKTDNAMDTDEAHKIFITSDPHYLAQNLYDSSALQEFMDNGDCKMLWYSDEIVRAFINDAVTQKPSAVIFSGDLTLNGERESHEELARILKQLQNAGIKALVLPGNHDINNPSAREIKSGGMRKTDYVTPEQFRSIYKDFGYDGEFSYDPHSLSYMSKLNDSLYILMLDTCMYESNIESAASCMDGKIRDETMEWVEASVELVRSENKDALILTAMHHNILVHNRSFQKNYVVHSADRRVEQFEEMGLELFFSGHLHIQNILTEEINGRTVTEVASSALTTYPVTYGVAEVDGGALSYYTQPVDLEAYARANRINDENLLDFERYSKDVFIEKSGKLIESTLKTLEYSEEEIVEAAAIAKQINAYYFAGIIDQLDDGIFSSKGYAILTGNNLTDDYLAAIFENGTGENNRFTK